VFAFRRLAEGFSENAFPPPAFAEDKLRGNDYNADSRSAASAVDKLRRVDYRLV